MEVRNCIENCIVMIREANKIKIAKQYRQTTQRDEIARESEKMMTTINWKEFQETNGLDKLYKYHKENYIKKELKSEHDEMAEREREIINLEFDLEALRNWKNYFMAVYEQEGDIEINSNECEDLLMEVEDNYKINKLNNKGDD